MKSYVIHSQTYSIGPLKRVSGDEDCLYLNVYVPEARYRESKKKTP